MMSSGFKVCVEPLATARIKQINYDGEEIYQELVVNKRPIVTFNMAHFTVENRQRHRH